MDRNTVMGFVLLALLFFGYFYYSSQGKLAYEKQQQHIADSLKKLAPLSDSSRTAALKRSGVSDMAGAAGQPFLQDSTLKETQTILENKVFKVTFTNKGGQPLKVVLNDFKSYNHSPLVLVDGNFNNLSYRINIGNNQTAETSDLLFTPSQVQTTSDGKQVLDYTLTLKNGAKIIHEYTVLPDDYRVGLTIRMEGASQLVSQHTLNLTWQAKANRQERDMFWETQQSQISYVEHNDYDFEHVREGKSDSKKLVDSVNWVALKQQFFASTLIAPGKFENADLQWESPSDTSLHVIAKLTANLQLKVPEGDQVSIPLQLFYGPGDYKILKSYGNQLYNLVPLGNGITAFVKYINRGFIIPVFDFLAARIKSYGLIIALLTIAIRLLISPLTYQSYVSGAKMKLLKPEIDELKAKFGEDKQAMGVEQMKLYKSAGVNPLGGCIPALFQVPIFFALYDFFNSSIMLRGQSFWWTKDLSSYDSIYNFSFTIPFYGNHISLFTIFAVSTSLLISLYGMSNMQDNSNPMMKYLPFIFPVVLLGVFNRLPSALTWYYTVSNVITLMIQFVIQQFIIDHDKIRAKLQENKKRPVTQSKWQEKINAMQESNKKLKELKQKTDNRKK